MSSSLCGCHCLRIEKSGGSRRDLSGGSSDPGFGSKEKFLGMMIKLTLKNGAS